MLAFAAQMALNYPKYKAQADQLMNLLSGLGCKIQGSCAPKLQLAAQQLGLAGYSRQLGKDWWYFLPTGENLGWHDDGVVAWYAATGLREQIAGIAGQCCAKSKYPPREFFPNLGNHTGLITATIEGITVNWDKQKWNEAQVREAVRTQKLAAQGNTSLGNNPSDSIGAPAANDTSVTLAPTQAGIMGGNMLWIALAGLGFLLLPKLMKGR